LKAATILSSAKQPVLLVGSQALLCNDEVVSGELSEAITKLGIPTFFSGMARGLLGQNSKVQCRHKESRRKALREADVVILVNSFWFILKNSAVCLAISG
jgi:acetolactate synthase-like protein